jgi:predicted PurR-regulated permease PerM
MTAVFLALFGAMVIGESVRPAVNRLSDRMSSSLATAIVFALLFALLGLLVFVPLRLMLPQLQELWSALPGYAARAGIVLRHFAITREQIAPFAATVLRDRLGIGQALAILSLALVMAIFWLGASAPLTAFVLTLLPPRLRGDYAAMFSEIGSKLGAYIGGTLLNGAIVALASTGFLLAVRAPYPIALGVLQGVLVGIPYLGTFVGAVTVAVVAGVARGWLTGAEFAASIGLIAALEGSFVAPLIFRKSVDVDPLGCVVATAAGGALFGIPGVLLAVPAASVITTVVVRAVAPMIRHRTSVLVVACALVACACVGAHAQDRLDGDALLARAAQGGGLKSYEVPMHFAVHLRRPIGARGSVEGTAYFKAPAQAVLAITNAPPIIRDFFKGTYDLDMVTQTWPAKYHVTAVALDERGGSAVYVLHAVPRFQGTIDQAVFTVAQADLAPMSAEWIYHDNSSIRVSFTDARVGDLILPHAATITVEMPGYGLDATALYGAYELNGSFPDDVLRTK